MKIPYIFPDKWWISPKTPISPCLSQKPMKFPNLGTISPKVGALVAYFTHSQSAARPTTPPLHAYSVVGYLNKDENIPVFIPRIGNPSEFRERRRDPSCAQGTSNGSSREIYPKLYVNSITVINTGENHDLSRCARVAYECIRNNLFM